MGNDKTCRRCKQTKSAAAFYHSKRRPDGLRDWCKDCERLSGQTYAAKNKEKIDDNRRRYWDIPENRERRRRSQNQLYHTKRDRFRAKRRIAYQENADHIKGQVAQYRKQNPDKVYGSRQRTHQKRGHVYAARHRRWRQQNAAALQERRRSRYAENPEPIRMLTRQRRARKRQAIGDYTVVERALLCEWFGGVCLACGNPDDLTVDHVIPLALNGANTISNLQPLCRSCNSSKKTKTTDYRPYACLVAFLETL